MSPDLNEIAASQSKRTLHTKLATDMLINYAHTYPNAKTRYHTIIMILHVEADAAYLVMSGAHSCISGKYYLSYYPPNPFNPSYVKPNGTILNKCKTLRYVVVSAEEADTGGIFINGHQIVPI